MATSYPSSRCTDYGMEISAEKTKLITNNTSGINTEIKVNGQKAFDRFWHAAL